MGRLFLVCLGLLCEFPSVIQAQIAQSNSIVGPDGRGPAPLAPRPSQPSLEEQLRRKRKIEKEQPRSLPNADQPATSTDELLSPQEKEQFAALQQDPENERPRFRMSLALAPASAKKLAGSIDTWRFDPGTLWETEFRLSDPNKPYTFWTGWRLAAWNGSGQSAETFARFSAMYIGPLFAFEWQGIPRHQLAFGLAGISRQTDPDFPGNSNQTATKPLGFDGSGLWASYGMGFRILQNFEWEDKLGIQSGASYLLSYLSLGVSLWSE